MRLIIESRRRRWVIDCTRDDCTREGAAAPTTGEDSQLDAMVERAHPDDVPQHAELDHRRRPSIGFQP